MKLIRLGIAAIFLLTASRAVFGQQEASEIRPEVQNRLKDPASSAQAYSSAVLASETEKPQAAGLDFNITASTIGYTFSAGSPDFDYGAEITPPLEDLSGGTLTLSAARAYWRPEPARPDEAIKIGGDPAAKPVLLAFTERYYYSPHADRIFASQTGNITITWVTALPDNNGDFDTEEKSYTIGFGTPLTAHTVYWTEFTYKAPLIRIPSGIVQDLTLLYNDRFPANVPDGDKIIPSGVDEQTIPNETIWYDSAQGTLRAYNVEGRLMIEYLGHARGQAGSGLREHLGLEIIDVRKELAPITVTTVIGEQLLPSSSEPGVILAPVVVRSSASLVAPHVVENRAVYYGIGENLQAPVVEFYWLEEGTHTIQWPRLRNNYLIQWPANVSDFEGVFARHDADTADSVVASTFLNLLATNTPELIHQDDPKNKEAAIDFQFRLAVDLDTKVDPFNRSLIRFSNGNDFWYMRLYSATTAHLRTLDVAGIAYNPNEPLDFHISRNVVVGQRLEPPHSSLALGGYIDPASGDAYDTNAYVDPFTEGGVEDANFGAIIPVNALPENNHLRVWWFRKLEPPTALANLFKPIFVPVILGDYTISYSSNAPQIVLASNAGTGELNEEQTSGEIYYQNDPSKPGYNPNEEHAVMIAGRGYALRDDLNVPGVTSDPFVLISHDDADGRPDMSVFGVVRENVDHKFDYPAIAGRRLQAPMPLPVLPQPLDDKGKSKNKEVTAAGIDSVLMGPAEENLKHYDSFTFQDRNGDAWVYRGLHNPSGTTKKLSMQYYYPTLESFAFPNAANGVDQAPALGTIVPYLRPVGATDNAITGTPLTILFTPGWPDQSPILHFGETLAKPKFGLPQVHGATSAQLLYQQSVALDFKKATPSVVLHDSTIRRVKPLSELSTISEIPSSVLTTVSAGITYFQNLPTHMQTRVFYDPNLGSQGAMVYTGEFVNELAGEDYVLPNTFNPDEIKLIEDLCLSKDPKKPAWITLVNSVSVKSVFKRTNVLNQVVELDYDKWLIEEKITKVIGQNGASQYGPSELPQLVGPDQVVNAYLLTAVGGGSGYVTLVTGNGKINSDQSEPVQMHVFRVGEKLYQGELKPLVSSNPLSENVTVQHTGDFAGRADQYEFEWKKAPPDGDDLAPAVYEFENVPLGNGFASPAESRNTSTITGQFIPGTAISTPLPYESSIYETDADRTAPGLRLTGNLDFTPQLGAGKSLSKVYLSLKLHEGDGAVVSLNGIEILRYNALSGQNSEPAPSIPTDYENFLTGGGGIVVFDLPARVFVDGANSIEVLYNTEKPNDVDSIIDVRVVIQRKVDTSSNYFTLATEEDKNRHVVSGSGIDTLGDNYYIMRYRPTDDKHPLYRATDPIIWSEWTSPSLVEGWIKRVLRGINPFNQRITDFFENAVDTNVSMISQAGPRWEGNVALNLQAVQDAGLIEIYETVLKRGIDLSINGTPAIDYGPANSALLLAAGYLSDLYMALGNEAFADAANPTVHFDSQALGTLGDATSTQGFEETFRSTSTARFSFQGQVPTLLDEELALLRGRDDFLSPSIETSPVYNRLFWNYTRGIDAGELIYALNYNIREQSDAVADGKIDAVDAARMFPQAHGDAYGHYLTAVKNYYRLLTNPEFTWGTRIEAVNVLGQSVSIDYFDERKFAAGAAALARTASQVIALERRKAFQSGTVGWENLTDGKVNDRTGTIRYWGVDQWAARSGQGAYFNWLVGNATVPDEDLVNEGIQKIDRSTVPELDAIAKAADQIQKQIEAADARVNPLDLSNDSMLFDISPAELASGETHFEQIYQRATTALANANAVFERASDSTRLLRATENQTQNLTQVVDDEETAFIAELIDIYGEPYPGDVGAGKVYPQGYTGPDLVRYAAIDRPFKIFSKSTLFSYDNSKTPAVEKTKIFTLNLKTKKLISSINDRDIFSIRFFADDALNVGNKIQVPMTEDQGPYILAGPELGKRPSVGKIQNSLNQVRLSEEQLFVALATMDTARTVLDINLRKLETEIQERFNLRVANTVFRNVKFIYEQTLVAIRAIKRVLAEVEATQEDIVRLAISALPTVVGFSNDLAGPVRAALYTADIAAKKVATAAKISTETYEFAANFAFILAEKGLELAALGIEEKQYLRAQIAKVKSLYAASYAKTREVDALALAHVRALETYRTELSNGRTVLANREVFRRRAAAAVQGYRTRDIAFRTFRTEALEEYQTLLDWGSRYAFLAAQAYDYETGLLGSATGRQFLGDIISSRAIGVLGDDGQPTLSASPVGDPGLSGLLAKLKNDYNVVKSRLGFNNPETNGTTFSLRRELYRIPDTAQGDAAWQEKLEGLVQKDLLADADIAAHAMQLSGSEVASQPGFLISLQSIIEDGRNFFGKDLGPGDSTYTTTNFATKISSVGVIFEGYHGMASCPICLSGHDHADALSATPYVYLLPAGLDIMRTPPLGDGKALREWTVRDLAMPMPFDLGNLEPTSEAVQQTSDSLRAIFRTPRRHPAFRATDIPDYFYTSLAADYTSSRLIGRSVWNTNWKLAIPAKGLLADESEGMARFIRSVKDIKLHLKTYSYSGN
jgi:hypothetical protein